MTQIRVASVQPRAYRRQDEQRNVELAMRYLDEAAAAGARIVSFPEGFPGPYYDDLEWSAFESIAEKAREHRIHVIYGTVDPVPDETPGAYCVALRFIGPDGKLVDTYHRLQPTPDEVNRVLTGEKAIAPGQRVVVHDVEGVRIGMLICSEIFCPELVRLVALEGAEIIFAPIGALIYELRETWRCILWARAIENLCYVVTCQNLYGMEDGLGLIAGPEAILVEKREPGLVIADCDIDRIRWLRSQHESLELPKPYKVVPGLLGYRRPELYRKLVDENIEHYDFYHYRKPHEASTGR
jgi:predicted amidohydrolase